jgi:hypothetical protein
VVFVHEPGRPSLYAPESFPGEWTLANLGAEDVACRNMKANSMSTWLALLLGFVLGVNLGLLVAAIFDAARSSAAQGVLQ